MDNEVYFIQHCENESCDIGRCAYTCPHCDESDDNYEIWWDQDDIMDGIPSTFQCPKCQGKIKIQWNENEHVFYADKSE